MAVVVVPAVPAAADHTPVGGSHGAGGSNSDGSLLGWAFAGRALLSGGGGGRVPCTFADGRQGYLWVGATWAGNETWEPIIGEGIEGTAIRIECRLDGEDYPIGGPYDSDIYDFIGIEWVPTGELDAVFEFALEQLDISNPEIATSPSPATASLVGIDTWFWLDGGMVPVAETISVLGGAITVTLTARPVSVTFATGDGATVACPDGGRPYAPGATSSCTHVYERSSAGQEGDVYPVTATVTWEGAYTVNVGGGESLGTVERESATTLPVAEGQAVVTR